MERGTGHGLKTRATGVDAGLVRPTVLGPGAGGWILPKRACAFSREVLEKQPISRFLITLGRAEGLACQGACRATCSTGFQPVPRASSHAHSRKRNLLRASFADAIAPRVR